MCSQLLCPTIQMDGLGKLFCSEAQVAFLPVLWWLDRIAHQVARFLWYWRVLGSIEWAWRSAWNLFLDFGFLRIPTCRDDALVYSPEGKVAVRCLIWCWCSKFWWSKCRIICQMSAHVSDQLETSKNPCLLGWLCNKRREIATARMTFIAIGSCWGSTPMGVRAGSGV